MVGDLHSTEKRLAQGFLLEKLAKLEVGTGGKTSGIVIGVKVCVYLRNKTI